MNISNTKLDLLKKYIFVVFTVEMKIESNYRGGKESNRRKGNWWHIVMTSFSPAPEARLQPRSVLTFLTLACSFSASFSDFLASLSSCLEVNCDPQRNIQSKWMNMFKLEQPNIDETFLQVHTFSWKSVSVETVGDRVCII